MTILTSFITPRLQYIADFISNELEGNPATLLTDIESFRLKSGVLINYTESRTSAIEIWICPHKLLNEKDIHPQQLECFDWNGIKAFFSSPADLPFDLFAASFYLLSRYEEYLPYDKDIYGRYAHENALAFKEQFLDLPLVNIWLARLSSMIKEKFTSFIQRKADFTFLPTYDIDMAWSYKNKGVWRNLGGFLRSFFSGNWAALKDRMLVLRQKRQDPYDNFGWMNALHSAHKVKPYYFFLLADQGGKYDKNISPDCVALQEKIRDQFIRYPVGIHPSWQSGDDDLLLKKEIQTLGAITGRPVQASRQHYIRFTLPVTYRKLLENGIRYDFSMGYGSINGFRASVASAFFWYDLAAEQQTKLLLFPFCFMDANSLYEQKDSAQKALADMKVYYQSVKSVNGIFIMIWHNHFLGTDPHFAGWKEVYSAFIGELSPVNA